MRDSAQLGQRTLEPPSAASDAALLRLARAIADSGELVQALADAVAQQHAQRAPAPPERPRTRAVAAAARAAEQTQERKCEPALQRTLTRLAARLQAGAAGQPLLPEQEAAVLLQRVRQQLVLRERLGQRLEAIKLECLAFAFRGCIIEMSRDCI
jgi:hypothetical protein